MDKEQVLGRVDDLVSDFLYYDRKSDEDMPVGKINEFISIGVVQVDEIVERFRSALITNLRA